MKTIARQLIVITALMLVTVAGPGIAASEPQSRIVNGTRIDISTVPYTVAMLNRQRVELDGNLFQAQFCGGTVIDTRWVLSAAHCFVNADTGQRLRPESVLVLIGSSDLTEPVTQPVAVTDIIVHERFLSTSDGQDIALVRLASDAAVPAIALDAQAVSAGDAAYVAGWGALNSGDDGRPVRFPTNIQGAPVRMLAGDTCEAAFSVYRGLVDDTNICAAGSEGQDSCFGDSGGPLLRLNDADGQPVSVAGITSWGFGCGESSAPGVYTRVGSYIDWILDNAENNTIQVRGELPTERDPAPSAIPEIVSPAPGTILSGSSVRFEWRANGAPVSQWFFRIGSSLNGREFADVRITDPRTSSREFSGLPVDGRDLFVQFSYRDSRTGVWTSINERYTAFNQQTQNPVPPDNPGDTPELINPVPGSTLAGSSAQFQWRSNGYPVWQWYFRIGRTLNGSEIAETRITDPATTSRVFSELPVDGSAVYVQFSYRDRRTGVWTSINQRYTAFNEDDDQSPVTPVEPATPELLSPSAGSVLAGSSVRFRWRSNGTPVSQWYFRIGNSPGSEEFANVRITNASATSRVFSGLPVDGRVLYVEFSYRDPGTGRWTSINEQFTAANERITLGLK